MNAPQIRVRMKRRALMTSTVTIVTASSASLVDQLLVLSYSLLYLQNVHGVYNFLRNSLWDECGRVRVRPLRERSNVWWPDKHVPVHLRRWVHRYEQYFHTQASVLREGEYLEWFRNSLWTGYRWMLGARRTLRERVSVYRSRERLFLRMSWTHCGTHVRHQPLHSKSLLQLGRLCC